MGEDSLSLRRVLIANRGEIALRVLRACREAGIVGVAVHSLDDAVALHVQHAVESVALSGTGVRAYLDGAALIEAAIASQCDAVHPGYGFLSEDADFARACEAAGLRWIGPEPATLDLFGDKATARGFAIKCGVPVVAGTGGPTDLDAARVFFDAHAADGVMVKAVAGGGGRGIRLARSRDELDAAWATCSAEATGAFGKASVYVERYVPRARHIEVQIVGDGDEVRHLFERECSVQRHHQKLIELAPSPWLPPEMRHQLFDAAIAIGRRARYRGIGTVEFLVAIDAEGACTGDWFFIELNPRIQVEHTVTEEITGVDLVDAQLRLADGCMLAELPWPATATRAPEAFAIQCRVNTEARVDGAYIAATGTLTAFAPPTGGRLRIESHGYVGWPVSLAYDTMLAKLIATSAISFPHAVGRAANGLRDFRIAGVDTNRALLLAVLNHPAFLAGLMDTGFVEQHLDELLAVAPTLPLDCPTIAPDNSGVLVWDGRGTPIAAPQRGQLTRLDVTAGETVVAGQPLATIEAMKMEHVVRAPASGVVAAILVQIGTAVEVGLQILSYDPVDAPAGGETAHRDEGMHEPIAALHERRAALDDEQRAATTALADKRGALSARARIAELLDAGSFSEIGGLAHHPGMATRAPADGVVTGRGRIDGRPVLVLAQDFSVMGGSAGHLGMAKMERLAALALDHGLPLVMLLDGGGHRVQDGQNSRDYAQGTTLFQYLVDLSGWVPVVAAILGAGFAANTNFAGCADFVVMLRDRAVMGLAGPALVSAGTGEVISAKDLGGAALQADRTGLAHLAVDDEPAALAAVRAYLSYLPVNAGALPPATHGPTVAPDPSNLAAIVPANSRRSYDMHAVIDGLVDCDSFFAIMPSHARNIITGFARLDGAPIGLIANQPQVSAGMIDAAASEKAAHFVAICDAFGLPLVYLIDVPGFAIGSAAELSKLGRRSARLIHELGIATVPRVSVTLRKGYGLAYIAMNGGRSFAPDGAFAWPTAEICAMSVEGSVELIHRREIAAARDPASRRRELIEGIRDQVSATEAAAGFGIDDLIAPAETRDRIIATLATAPRRRARAQLRVRPISPI